MSTTLSSDAASQYCIVRKYARTSCAGPGMKRSNLGRRRSIAICFAPPLAPGFGLPRNFFISAITPVAGLSMR